MRRFRQLALMVLFAGWMLPAFLAQAARARAATSAPAPRTPLGMVSGIAPAPPPAERLASMFNSIAIIWVSIALVYAVVLTLRLRRTLVP
jgi:hypothetical protein